MTSDSFFLTLVIVAVSSFLALPYTFWLLWACGQRGWTLITAASVGLFIAAMSVVSAYGIGSGGAWQYQYEVAKNLRILSPSAWLEVLRLVVGGAIYIRVLAFLFRDEVITFWNSICRPLRIQGHRATNETHFRLSAFCVPFLCVIWLSVLLGLVVCYHVSPNGAPHVLLSDAAQRRLTKLESESRTSKDGQGKYVGPEHELVRPLFGLLKLEPTSQLQPTSGTPAASQLPTVPSSTAPPSPPSTSVNAAIEESNLTLLKEYCVSESVNEARDAFATHVAILGKYEGHSYSERIIKDILLKAFAGGQNNLTTATLSPIEKKYLFDQLFFAECQSPYIAYLPYSVIGFVAIFGPLLFIPAIYLVKFGCLLHEKYYALEQCLEELDWRDKVERKYTDFWDLCCEDVPKYSELPLLVAFFFSLEFWLFSATISGAALKLSIAAALSVAALSSVAIAWSVVIEGARNLVRKQLKKKKEEEPKWFACRTIEIFFNQLRKESTVGVVAGVVGTSLIMGVILKALGPFLQN